MGHLRFRLATKADLPTCRELLHPGIHLSARCRDRLPDMWGTLIAQDAMNLTIIEDRALPKAKAIEGCGATMFVSDAFAEDALNNPRPFLAARIYEAILAGSSPALPEHAVGHANASTGLALVVLHFGLRNHDLSDPRTQQVLQAASAAFYFFHSGYRLNVIVNEVFGTQHLEYMQAGGFARSEDFANAKFARSLAASRPHHPYLCALHKASAVCGAINQLWFLFNPPQPILGLTRPEQRVLVRALLNESDARISHDLDLSLDAVKKTWRRIYEHVEQRAPFLLASPQEPAPAGRRREEKRRHVLDYLRSHPEELRPFKA